MGRRKKGQVINGWVALDKPVGMTSTQAVGKVRWLFDAQKAGHGGTLDPLASGILPIALGEATKTVPFIMDRDKVYRFDVRWGEARSTDDGEGEVIATSDVRPAEDAICEALKDFVGDIEQIPPQYSAIKVDGERAYDIARSGEQVDLKARTVSIYQAALIGCPDADTATIEIECGKGTYVRSLARDLAEKLGTKGYVSRLERPAVGPFDETNAISLAKLEELSHSAAHFEHLLGVETVLDDIPALAITSEQAGRVRQGRSIFVGPGALKTVVEAAPQTIALGAETEPALEDEGDLVYAMDRTTLVALGFVSKGEFHPTRVFRL